MNAVVKLHPWQRQGYLSSLDNQLYVDGVSAQSLVDAYGSPLYVYSQQQLERNASGILSSFRAIHKNTTVCFASKAAANIAVLRVLKAAGLAIEINSGGEFFKAKKAGFSEQEMVFNGVAKLQTEIAEVVAAGIKAINVDSISELRRILSVAESINQCANVTLRIIPEIKGGAAAGWETGTSESKFGMTKKEQLLAINIINDNCNHLKLVGIHAHIGTQVNDISAYQKEADFLLEYLKEVQALIPYALNHVNLGGGFPKNYSSGDENWQGLPEHYKQQYRTHIDFDILAKVLIKPMSVALGEDVEIIVEPGRSMVSDCAILLTRIEAEKERDQFKVFYLDAGYSVLFDAFIGWYFHMINANKADDVDTHLFRLAGPLCDSSDTFYDVEGEGRVKSLLKSSPFFHEHLELLNKVLVGQPSMRELPASTAIGDVIAICDVGAYALEMMNDYCGRMQAAAVMISDDQQVKLIRRRSEPEDLLRFDIY